MLASKLWFSFKVLLLLAYVSNDIQYVSRLRDIMRTTQKVVEIDDSDLDANV